MIKNNKNYQDRIHDMDYGEHNSFSLLTLILWILLTGVLVSACIGYNKYYKYNFIDQQENVPVYGLRDIDI